MCKHVGARAHQRHITHEDVYELWQLIDVGTAHEVSEGELAGVVLGGLHLVGIGVDVHGAELIAVELLSIKAVALLAEEYGSRALALDDSCHYDVDDGEERQQEYGTHKQVQSTLHGTVAEAAQRFLTRGEHKGVSHLSGDHVAACEVDIYRHHEETYHVVLTEREQCTCIFPIKRSHRAIHCIDVVGILFQIRQRLRRHALELYTLGEILLNVRGKEAFDIQSVGCILQVKVELAHLLAVAHQQHTRQAEAIVAHLLHVPEHCDTLHKHQQGVYCVDAQEVATRYVVCLEQIVDHQKQDEVHGGSEEHITGYLVGTRHAAQCDGRQECGHRHIAENRDDEIALCVRHGYVILPRVQEGVMREEETYTQKHYVNHVDKKARGNGVLKSFTFHSLSHIICLSLACAYWFTILHNPSQ